MILWILMEILLYLDQALMVSEDPRQQSTKVEKSKIQCLSFTKHKKYVMSNPSSESKNLSKSRTFRVSSLKFGIKASVLMLFLQQNMSWVSPKQFRIDLGTFERAFLVQIMMIFDDFQKVTWLLGLNRDSGLTLLKGPITQMWINIGSYRGDFCASVGISGGN